MDDCTATAPHPLRTSISVGWLGWVVIVKVGHGVCNICDSVTFYSGCSKQPCLLRACRAGVRDQGFQSWISSCSQQRVLDCTVLLTVWFRHPLSQCYEFMFEPAS